MIHDGAGKYFLARRGPTSRDDVGKWEFPGGTVDFYETREQAVQRLMRKKLGIELVIEDILGVYDVIDRDNKDHWLSTTFMATIRHGEPKTADATKHTDVGWFTLDELLQLELSRITRLNVADLLNKP